MKRWLEPVRPSLEATWPSRDERVVFVAAGLAFRFLVVTHVGGSA